VCWFFVVAAELLFVSAAHACGCFGGTSLLFLDPVSCAVSAANSHRLQLF